MVTKQKWIGGLAVAALAVFTTPALAQEAQSDWESEWETEETVIPESEQDQLGEESKDVAEAVVPSGERAKVRALKNFVVEGGGAAWNYTGDVGNVTDMGGGLTARGIFGARTMLGGEIAYYGGLTPIKDVNQDLNFDVGTNVGIDETIYTNAFQALARVNFANEKAMLKPFLAGGASYHRLDSGVNAFNNQNGLGIPLAAGLQFYPAETWTIGARGEFEVLTSLIDEEFPDGDRWGGTLTVGAHF